MSERDLRHPPIETAYGVRVGDVIDQWGVHATVVEMRAGYATGSGVRAFLKWDEEGIAKSRDQRRQSHSLKDPIHIDDEAIVKRAPGYRANELPDGINEQDPRPTELIDALKWEMKQQRQRFDREMIALDQRMILLENEIKAAKRLVWKLMDRRERQEMNEG